MPLTGMVSLHRLECLVSSMGNPVHTDISLRAILMPGVVGTFTEDSFPVRYYDQSSTAQSSNRRSAGTTGRDRLNRRNELQSNT